MPSIQLRHQSSSVARFVTPFVMASTERDGTAQTVAASDPKVAAAEAMDPKIAAADPVVPAQVIAASLAEDPDALSTHWFMDHAEAVDPRKPSPLMDHAEAAVPTRSAPNGSSTAWDPAHAIAFLRAEDPDTFSTQRPFDQAEAVAPAQAIAASLAEDPDALSTHWFMDHAEAVDPRKPSPPRVRMTRARSASKGSSTPTRSASRSPGRRRRPSKRS